MAVLELEIPVQFNHIAFTVPREVLVGESRDKLREFFTSVFGFKERGEFTKDRELLVFMAGGVDQFVVFFGNEQPTQGRPDDHFGMRVNTLENLHTFRSRAEEFKVTAPETELSEYEAVPMNDEVPHNLHRFYVKFGTPFTLEIQYYEMLDA
jgi:hypothetical protein